MDKLDWIYHSTACRAAVKGGDESRPEELKALAERVLLAVAGSGLSGCDSAYLYACCGDGDHRRAFSC